jgi:hypothetical protein
MYKLIRTFAAIVMTIAAGNPMISQTTQTVVDHLEKSTQTYVGSPSIALLPDGTLLASHDIFGPASAKNTTRVFASRDGGLSWSLRAEIHGQFWSTLFVHQGLAYLMGPDSEFGAVVIRRSQDGGRTWTEPLDSQHGKLLEGRFHTAPTPVVEHEDRLWRAMEDVGGPGDWPSHFRSFVLSASKNSNLLNASSWIRSNTVASDQALLDHNFHGWLEGNAVVLPNNSIGVLLRVDAKPLGDKAALAAISQNGRIESFDPSTGIISMPGGSVKFTVRMDEKTKQYWSITNVLPVDESPANPGIVRNTLALIRSKDLHRWEVVRILWHHDDELHYGSQYVDWVFDKDDLVAVARTANSDESGGAHDFHDANFLTFFRVKGFRDSK